MDHSPIGIDVRQALAHAADSNLTADKPATSGYVLPVLQVATWAVCQPEPSRTHSSRSRRPRRFWRAIRTGYRASTGTSCIWLTIRPEAVSAL